MSRPALQRAIDTRWLWIVCVGWALIDGFYAGAERGAPPLIQETSPLLLFLLAWWWLNADARSCSDPADECRGVGFFLLWPFFLVAYGLRTRGWAGVSRAACWLIVVLAAGWATGVLIGVLALRN